MQKILHGTTASLAVTTAGHGTTASLAVRTAGHGTTFLSPGVLVEITAGERNVEPGPQH